MKPSKQHPSLFLCIYFPLLAIERFKLTALISNKKLKTDHAIALCHYKNGQSLVACCCPQGYAAQITTGMSAAFARTRCTNLIVGRFSPQGDYKLLESFAALLGDISPRIGIDSEVVRAHNNNCLSDLDLMYYGLVVDLRGTERLHGNYSELAQTIASRYMSRGYTCRIGRGSTIGTAWACSRFHPLTLSEYHSHQNNILPAQSLRIPLRLTNELLEFGLATIEDIMGIPLKELSLRFDRTLLLRIDQFRGTTTEQLALYSNPVSHSLSYLFEPALESHERICQSYSLVTKAIYEQLLKKSVYAEAFAMKITCLLEGGERTIIEQSFSFYRPTYTAEHLCQVITQHFEASRLPGMVSLIEITAHSIKPLCNEQLAITHCTPDNALLDSKENDMLLNSLLLTLGGQAVRTLRFLNSYVPEQSFAFVPVIAEETPNYLKSGSTSSLTMPPGERPTYLLNKPIPLKATALMPDHPPARIEWNSKHYRLVRGRGPERIDSAWWNSSSQQQIEQREYFCVQESSGRWLWIYRLIPSQEWFLHGLWN